MCPRPCGQKVERRYKYDKHRQATLESKSHIKNLHYEVKNVVTVNENSQK